MVLHDPHLKEILVLLETHKDGLSNAELDAALSNNSQWVTYGHVRELVAMGLVEYRPELFGNPGKYIITESGAATIMDQKL